MKKPIPAVGLHLDHQFGKRKEKRNNEKNKNYIIYFSKTTSHLKMIATDGVLTGYNLHGTTLDVDTWYNLRITFNTADKSYNVYVNGESIYTATIDTITGITGLTVGANKACGGSLGIQFDNTYCGTSELEGFTKGTGVYFNKYSAVSLDYEGLSMTNAGTFNTQLNALGVYRAGTTPSASTPSAAASALGSDFAYADTEGDDEYIVIRLRDTTGTNATNYPAYYFTPLANGEDGALTTYVFETDVRFASTESAVGCSNGRNGFAFMMNAWGNVGAKNSNVYQSPNDSNPIEEFTHTLTAVKEILDNDNKTITAYQLGDEVLELDKWYNIRITFDTATGALNVYLNGDATPIITETWAGVTAVTGCHVAANTTIGGNWGIHLDNTYFGTYTE